MVENVNKQIVAVHTLLLFDRAKVEQFSAGAAFVLDLLSLHRNVGRAVAEHDLVFLQVGRCSE